MKRKRIRREANGWVVPCSIENCNWESYPDTVHMGATTNLKKHLREHELGIYPYEQEMTID